MPNRVYEVDESGAADRLADGNVTEYRSDGVTEGVPVVSAPRRSDTPSPVTIHLLPLFSKTSPTTSAAAIAPGERFADAELAREPLLPNFSRVGSRRRLVRLARDRATTI